MDTKLAVTALSGTALVVGVTVPAVVYSSVPVDPLGVDPIVAMPLVHATTVLALLMVLASGLLLARRRWGPSRKPIVVFSAIAVGVVLCTIGVSISQPGGGEAAPFANLLGLLARTVSNAVIVGAPTVVGACITLFLAFDTPWVPREGGGVVTAEPPAAGPTE